ncbi:MAG: tripartite tricarboxylate transporter TctB family protein [Pseudomonadota bacterium]
MILERIVLTALALVGFGAVIAARDFSDGTAHGSDLMPMLSGGLLAGLALIALMLSNNQTPVRESGKPWRLAAVLFGTSVFLWLLPIVGYPVVTPIWVAGTMYSLGMRRFLTIAAVSVALSAIAFFLLANVAFAPPPMGLFGAG